MISEPFVIHQFHETAPFNKNEDLLLRNKLLFESMLTKDEAYKPVMNAF